jgi:hypothetical protein
MALFKSKTKNQPRQARNQPVQRSTVNTYYRGDSHSPASPFAKQQPKRQVRKYVFGLLDIILLAAAVLGILYALALNDQPNIAASSSAYHDSSVYRIAAAEQLNHLKNRNKITFDQQGLAQQLQHRFPEIISHPGPCAHSGSKRLQDTTRPAGSKQWLCRIHQHCNRSMPEGRYSYSYADFATHTSRT